MSRGRRRRAATAQRRRNGQRTQCLSRQVSRRARRAKNRRQDERQRALLLNDGAEANHKPELEIYADDVECAHGSAIGALDADALFYLRQRGLSEAEARALLIEAFAGEVIGSIDDTGIRDVFASHVNAWLEAQR